MVTAAAILAFSVAWVLLLALTDQGAYGNARSAVSVELYRDYARKLTGGELPYLDFAFEYPPLALVPIVLPTLIGGSPFVEPAYRQMFQLVEAGFGMALVALVMRTVGALGRGRHDIIATAAMVAVSPMLLGPLMLSRYDLWPALLTAGAVWLLVAGHTRWAALAVGLGVLAKVYPVLLAPLALLYLWRREERREAIVFAAVVAGVVLVGLAPFAVIAPEGILDSLLRSFRRPLQAESTGAVLLFVRDLVTGERTAIVHTFDSYNLDGSLPQLVGTLQSIVLAVALLVTYWLYARGRPTLDRLVVGFAAALTAWVVFGRVFSPQYLIWLLPPLAIVAGRRWPLVQLGLALAVVMTGIYYPRFYTPFLDGREVQWIAVVLGRNLVLAALAGYLLARLRPGAEQAGADADVDGASRPGPQPPRPRRPPGSAPAAAG
jgi:uncharacterized membrane protein